MSIATTPADFMSDVETQLGSYTRTTNAVLHKAMVPASSGCVVGISYCLGRESIDLKSEAYQGDSSFDFAYSMKSLEAMSMPHAKENDDINQYID